MERIEETVPPVASQQNHRIGTGGANAAFPGRSHFGRRERLLERLGDDDDLGARHRRHLPQTWMIWSRLVPTLT